jgi:hypothetical protein
MSQDSAFSSFQWSSVGGMKEHSSDPGLAIPPTTNPSLDVFSRSTTGQLRPASRVHTQQLVGEQSFQATQQTGPSVRITGPVYDTSTTQSLVSALQATMDVDPAKVGRKPVIIPAEKRRTRTTQQLQQGMRLRWRLRHGVVLITLLGMALTTLLSLTPLGHGQSGTGFFSGVINWVQSQQQNWNITSHMDQSRQADNSTARPLPPMNLPKSEYVAMARQAAINAGINPDYFVRQIMTESGFNPRAVSPAGAIGIAQFMPGTAAGLGVDPWDPFSALNGAARLMANYTKQYGGDYAKALAAYNSGSGTVQYAIKMGGAYWMNYIPAETRNYIYKIMGI